MSYFYGPYVTVAEKMKKAKKMIQTLRNKGLDIHPVEAFTGAIANTFWGKSWCENLQKYADYENRIGRGRSYIRNGFICDLTIERGRVIGRVNGTSLYNVEVLIKPLEEERWQEICRKCAGQISSLVELLQGKFSKEVMSIVCQTETGLFPRPSEISFNCSCPDWASMCKHVCAVLFAVGHRLDEKPELLFTLRGVDPSDLYAAEIEVASDDGVGGIAGADMAELFGIDLEGEIPAPTSNGEQVTAPPAAAAGKGTPPFDPEAPTGAAIKKLRLLADMTEKEFSQALPVSLLTLRRWESEEGLLNMRSDKIKLLSAFQTKLFA